MSKDALQRITAGPYLGRWPVVSRAAAPAPPTHLVRLVRELGGPRAHNFLEQYTTAIYAFSFAQNPDLKGRVLLSIGGWTGSIYYSSAVATNASRVAFANAIEDTVRSTNVGKDLEITASVGIKPFLNGTGEPMDDVSAFGEVLNRIDQTEIMAYDIWGFWSTAVGPNAPLNDACELVQERQQGSAVSAVTAWTNAGFPITLGVASYGRSFFVDPDMALNGQQIIAYPAFNATQPLGPDDSTTCWIHVETLKLAGNSPSAS
ncbi:glycoside hydrolase superfamily [Mycena olivaceomarginata]|nr:glycoside hydrolase superfamily [Mycena olivaceomarginata]